MDEPSTSPVPAVPTQLRREAVPASALAVLGAAVDAGPEGMVVVSADGTLLAQNRRFVQMWPIPAEVIASGSDEAALHSVLDKLVDPDGFLRRVKELYERASGTSRDELHLLDGRVFDRHGSALHDADGLYVGWAWYFRDVTEERAAAIDAARMGALVSVAQALGAAADEPEVLQVVAGLGAAALDAQGAALCLDDGARLQVLTTSYFDESVRAEIADVPRDAPLPVAASVRENQALYLEDRAAAVALFPTVRDLYERADTEGSAIVPLRAGDRSLGALAVAFERPHPWRAEDRRLLEALASLTSQSLERIAAQRSEQASAQAVRRIAETLQRSLLTEPLGTAGLQVAVRYQAASQDAQVGGDWHDSFRRRDGVLTVVVGDVAGHDNDAAALMAQCRNVLRGVAQTLLGSPGAVLGGLDDALGALGVDLTATALLCQVQEPAPGGPAELVWSSAGHLPPALLEPGGRARLLATDPDLMLGAWSAADRADHRTSLEPGSSLVLYTDGLVERKGEHLDAGLDRLLAALAGQDRATPDELCDLLLAELGAAVADDVALLVLRVG